MLSPVTLQLQYKNLLSLFDKPVYVQIVIKHISNLIYIKYIIKILHIKKEYLQK